MSTSPDAASTTASPMSEAGRLVNVIVDPKPAFADIAARPNWWVPMTIITVFVLIFMVAFSTHVGWESYLRQQYEKSSQAQSMSPEDREHLLQVQLKYVPAVGTAMAVIGTPIAYLIEAAVLLFIFNFMFGAALKFRQVLAVSCYASLPHVVSTLGSLGVMFLKDPSDFDLNNPAPFNIGFFLDPKNTPAWLVSLGGSIDVFSLWVILLLATGLAVAAKKRWSTALTAVLIPWALWVVLKVGKAAIFGS